ncbi:MAG: EAL domain-containing protein, partial [Gammaproteobacteria bacterium]|nr:EAL domain-containing protein [Gammaproteobacteria bacterium]
YFFLIHTWYGYVLTIFSSIFTWVLFYSATSSYNLLMQANYQASHDVLTGLYNRYFFINYLQETMNSLKESRYYSYLLLIDLDHFKTINDSLGHDIGDRLLQDVSLRFRLHTPPGGMIARLGGDEFIITGRSYEDSQVCEIEAISLANLLIDELKNTYIIDKHNLYISASIGVSLIDPTQDNANTFIKQADIALYEVKATGRDGVFLFNDEISKRVEFHLEIERKLHFALEKNEISLVYQPQLNRDKKIIGAEALVRWNTMDLGIISPVDFIPIAEQTGIIIDLGTYILETALKDLRHLYENNIYLDQISVNISIRQFFHFNFVNTVKNLLSIYIHEDIKTIIIFEMTETILIEDIEKVIQLMSTLKSLGIHFSMDDFGTGYSSLSYLKRLPIDEIKIDRSFVSELHNADDNKSMITTILNMADIFKLNTVAEGIETAEQFDFLAENNCDIYQGFHLSKPLTRDKLETYYAEHQ